MKRYAVNDLVTFAEASLVRAGLDRCHAATTAQTIVETDLLGHHSHGLALLPRHVGDLRGGRMTPTGTPETGSSGGACLLVDGRMLPGPVVMSHAIDAAVERSGRCGAGLVVVRRSHHILALISYLERIARRNLMIVIGSSNPWAAFVAPFGGKQPVYSPNPVACGIPTRRDPILMDISLSSVAVNVCLQHHRRGEKLPGAYLLDANGDVTDDPSVLFEKPTGSVLPLGGRDLGYKGFALGLMVEAMTSALAGFGRADEPAGTSNAAFVLVVDPAAFGGVDAFLRETTWLAQACAMSEPTGEHPVRLPGQNALKLKRMALAQGCPLPDSLLHDLAKLGSELGVAAPAPADPQS